MSIRISRIVIPALLSLAVTYAQGPESPQSAAQRKIAWAETAISKAPDSFQAYNDLAMALSDRARETADTSYYEKATAAVEKSLALAPDNFEALKAKAWVLLGRHRFAEALKLAEELNKRVPDDLQVYGFLVDANVELGNYDKAEGAAQEMLDRRPGNVAAYTRTAYLREIFGLIPGAMELMTSAYHRIPPQELEYRAWTLTQLAHLHLLTGNAEPADQLLQEALRLHPGYHYALARLAEVRATQKNYSAAADLMQQRFEAAPHPENLFALAEALDRAGRNQAAESAYAKFEQAARAEMDSLDNANLELIFYYADHANNPAEALRVAQLEIGRRKNVHTTDAYAWALYKNGRPAEARQEAERALAVGIRDAKIFYRAATIAAAMKDEAAAMRYLQQSLDLNPHSEVAEKVRHTLARLKREL
jgi:tetratricopeptide (TPR) repeat protein